jgi:phage shock protein A
VDRSQDDLARAALERHKSSQRTSESFREQIADQRAQVETLKSALGKLEQKLAEAHAKSDMLLAQHRRARALGKASDARLTIGSASAIRTFDRMKDKVIRNEAVSQAKSELAGDNLDDRFAQLEHDDEVDRALAELKARRGVGV